LLRAAEQVLLAILHAFAEWPGRGDVDDLDARPRPDVHINPVEPGVLVHPAGAYRPDLPRRQRVGADRAVALQLGCGDEVLDVLRAHLVAEMGVAELGAADALLLLLDASAAFHRQPQSPFKVLVRDLRIAIWIQKL